MCFVRYLTLLDVYYGTCLFQSLTPPPLPKEKKKCLSLGYQDLSLRHLVVTVFFKLLPDPHLFTHTLENDPKYGEEKIQTRVGRKERKIRTRKCFDNINSRWEKNLSAQNERKSTKNVILIIVIAGHRVVCFYMAKYVTV